jgi:hypothetical protein
MARHPRDAASPSDILIVVKLGAAPPGGLGGAGVMEGGLAWEYLPGGTSAAIWTP